MRCEDPTAHTWKIEHWPRRLHCPSFEHRCRDESVEVKAISSVPVYCWMFSWFFWWFWKGNPKFGPTSTSLKFGPNSITEKFSHDEDTNTAVVSPWWPSQLSSLGVTRQGRTASNCAQWKMLASKSGCRFVKHRSGEPCYRYWMKLVTSPTWFVNVRQVFSSGNLQIRPSTVTAIWSYLICVIYEPGCLWGENCVKSGLNLLTGWHGRRRLLQNHLEGSSAPPLLDVRCPYGNQRCSETGNFNQLQITNPYCAVMFMPTWIWIYDVHIYI